MKRILILLPAFLLVAAVNAQDVPKAELFGGFSYSRGDIDLNMYGWNFEVAGVVNPWFSLVGDASGNYADIGAGIVDASLSIHSFAAGPQFSARRDSITGFARILVGGTRIGSGVFGVSGGDTKLGLVIGGGLDVPLSARFAIRAIQADWIYVPTNGSDLNQARISSGLLVRF
ncbi:MAG: hypothetical protein EHM61_25850 [Acidobacteria bacterium]|nr:MAG: hypothetical protein EHM61_25850 [Acidobacteriota bacterium]